jgi:hypothetical protein
MNLFERTRDLRDRIEKHAELRRANKEAEAIRERVNDIRAARETLAASLDKFAVLTTKGGITSKLPASATTIGTLDEYALKLSDPTNDAGKEHAKFKRSLDKMSKDVGSLIEKALTTIERDLPSINETFLKQVELIPAYAAKVALIRRQRDALLSGSDLGAMSAQQLSAFLDQRDLLSAHADSLKVNEFPADVLEFFASARRTGGAPLERLTDGVRKWLEERDQLKNVRVTVVGR